MLELTPSRLTMKQLLELQCTGNPIIITFNKVPFGLYIPCDFDNLTPDLKQVKDAIAGIQERDCQ